MTNDLLVQLRSYGDAFEATLPETNADSVVTGDAIHALVGSARRLPSNGAGDSLPSDGPETQVLAPVVVPRRGVWAAIAAVVIAVLIGGVAWLSQGGPDDEVIDEPVVTSIPTPTTTPLPPTTPTAAGGIVFDAFTAIGDADWDRFLGHLDPEGVIREGPLYLGAGEGHDPGAEHPWSVKLELREGFGLGLEDVDFDGDGVFTQAEQLLLSLRYLALAPIEILGCESVGDVVECEVKDTAVFHRAAGLDPAPIGVTVRDGRIGAIELGNVLSTSESGNPVDTDLGPVWVAAETSLGGCNGCDFHQFYEFNGQYMEWLGTQFAEYDCNADSLSDQECYQFRLDSPLGIGEVGMDFGGGLYLFEWIKPEGLAQHQELIPQWLASRGTDDPLRDLVANYLADISASPAPEPEFDTTPLGTEQGLEVTPGQEIYSPAKGGPAVTGAAWFTAVRLLDSDVKAAYWIDVIDNPLWYGIDGRSVAIRSEAGRDDGYSEGAWATYELTDSAAPFLVASKANGDRTYVAIGGLPVETSVVAITMVDGAQYWQRPVNGLVLFGAEGQLRNPVRLLDARGDDIHHVLVSDDSWTLVEPSQE